MADLEIEIVILDPGPHLDLLQLDPVLLLPGFACLSLFLVSELPVIHDSTDRGTRIRRDFHQVQSKLFCCFQRFLDGKDPELLALRVNDTDGADPDLLIYTRSLVDGRFLLQKVDDKKGPAKHSGPTTTTTVRDTSGVRLSHLWEPGGFARGEPKGEGDWLPALPDCQVGNIAQVRAGGQGGGLVRGCESELDRFRGFAA